MFDALVNGRIDTGSLRFEVEYHDIEELNRGAGLGRADISKISCAVLPAIAEHYALLDSGAALGRGNGPLLVRRAGDTRPIRRVAVPGLHTTANALMGKLFPQIEECTPLLFSRIAAAVERPMPGNSASCSRFFGHFPALTVTSCCAQRCRLRARA